MVYLRKVLGCIEGPRKQVGVRVFFAKLGYVKRSYDLCLKHQLSLFLFAFDASTLLHLYNTLFLVFGYVHLRHCPMARFISHGIGLYRRVKETFSFGCMIS